MVLVMGIVLFAMLQAVTVLAHRQSFASRGYANHVATHYAIQSGIAEVLDRLEQEPGWRGQYRNRALPQGGTYSVSFAAEGARPDAEQSVNNLQNDGPALGPDGTASIPPYSVYLRVSASAAGGGEQAAAVLASKQYLGTRPHALTSSGRILLQGAVSVAGIQSLLDPTPIEAGLHSNMAERTNDVIRWVSRGERATISGRVSVCSPQAGAINLGSDPSLYEVKDIRTDEAPAPLPSDDILGTIAQGRSWPAPAVNVLGITSLPRGQYYSSSSLRLNGDLYLNNCTLCVEGDLSVNGCIRGNGAVYVGGKTTFRGDSRVFTYNPEGVALFSHGSVYLTGFDATEYLRALALVDPVAAPWVELLEKNLARLRRVGEKNPASRFVGPSADPELNWEFNDARDAVGGGNDGRRPDGQQASRVKQRLELRQKDSVRDLLIRKLDLIANLCGEPTSPGRDDDLFVCRQWKAGNEEQVGVLEGALKTNNVEVAAQATAVLMRYSYLGSSYFQGIIYSNGFLRADNEVGILGAVWLEDDGTQPPETVDGVTLQPGDAFLGNRCQLVFNKDLARRLGGAYGGGDLRVWSWRAQ